MPFLRTPKRYRKETLEALTTVGKNNGESVDDDDDDVVVIGVKEGEKDRENKLREQPGKENKIQKEAVSLKIEAVGKDGRQDSDKESYFDDNWSFEKKKPILDHHAKAHIP